MDVVQISKGDQKAALEMLSAVLWLGNITFSAKEHESHVTVNENEGEKLFFWVQKCIVDVRQCWNSWDFEIPNTVGAANYVDVMPLGSKDACIFMISWHDVLRLLRASAFPMMISTYHSLAQACATAVSTSVRWISKAWQASKVLFLVYGVLGLLKKRWRRCCQRHESWICLIFYNM